MNKVTRDDIANIHCASPVRFLLKRQDESSLRIKIITIKDEYRSLVVKQIFYTSIMLLLFQIALFVSLTASAQSHFTISGFGQKIRNGDILYLSYNDSGRNILDSAIANDGRFSFSGVIHRPVKARIDRNENPEFAEVLTQSVDIYLEPGTIKINSPDTLAGAIISGTGLNDTLQLLHNNLKLLKTTQRAIKDPDLFTEEEKKDTALLNHNKKELEKIFYEMANIEIEFARDHPNSYVSLDLLVNRSRINRYIDKVAVVFENLSQNLKKTPQAQIIVERIKKKRQVAAGMTATDFTMNSAEEKAISLFSFKGKYVFLDFWASWCVPCREEHPNIAAQYEKYKHKGFTIVSVSIDTDKDKWLKAITKDKMTWTQVSDLKGEKGETYLKYGITTIPANFLIDPHGIVIAKDLKGDFLRDELAKIFSRKED